MKLVTLTAALLAATVSFANAQATPPDQKSDQQQMGTSPMSGQVQQAPMARQGQNGQFCLVTRDGGQNCGFATLAQCDAARKGVTSDTCTPNAQTTGQNPHSR